MQRLVLSVVLALLTTALPCAAAAARAAPFAIDDRGRRIELPAVPLRIVSLLPSLTETVCALHACERLVGVDRHSNWPLAVRALPQLGGLEDTRIEAIVALKPDLVLLAGAARVIDRLEALGLRVAVLEPKHLSDTRRVIEAVAQLLGVPAAGGALWQGLQQRIESAQARVPVRLRGQQVYVEVASAPYAAGEASFIGELLAQLGMRNIVPAALGPFPKLNPEYVVRAQPDVIVASAAALAEMPSRPGWGGLRALQAHRSCGFGSGDWDVLVRAGPRVADAADLFVACFERLDR